MSDPNEFHLTTLDPGGRTGWTHFCMDVRAFTRPENKVLGHIKWYESGVWDGTEHEIISKFNSHLLNTISVYGLDVSHLMYEVVSEDFDLVQTIGSKQNLLSPVRINAVVSWLCAVRAVKFRVQNRALRTSTTRERLKLFGFPGRFQKDEFAALQHAIYRLRTIKDESLRRPWKLADGSILNARWDCTCSQPGGKKNTHDLIHPQ